jgi:hypothetical protein
MVVANRKFVFTMLDPVNLFATLKSTTCNIGLICNILQDKEELQQTSYCGSSFMASEFTPVSTLFPIKTLICRSDTSYLEA